MAGLVKEYTLSRKWTSATTFTTTISAVMIIKTAYPLSLAEGGSRGKYGVSCEAGHSGELDC